MLISALVLFLYNQLVASYYCCSGTGQATPTDHAHMAHKQPVTLASVNVMSSEALHFFCIVPPAGQADPETR